MPPKVSQELCIGCGVCVFTCGKHVFTMHSLTGYSYPVRADDCVECFMCHVSCPKKAITLSSPFCQSACPSGVDVPLYVDLISQNKILDAYMSIKKETPFPTVCGYICHRPCEGKCRRGQLDVPVAIRALKKFVGDRLLEKINELPVPPKLSKRSGRIAIIGAGPAGLTAAYYLAILNYNVTVFEALPVAGGQLVVGIPSFRLPKKVLQAEIDAIKSMGVEIKLGVRLGKDISLDDLRAQGYGAIFLATGAHQSIKLNVPGEELDGVIQGLDFLIKANLGEKLDVKGKNVVVVGGGNVAIDVALLARRLGAKDVNIIYRRRKEDMPAFEESIQEGEAEGINFKFLISPVKIVATGNRVNGLLCHKVSLGYFEENGKRQLLSLKGSNLTVPADILIVAVGQTPEIIHGVKQGLESKVIMSDINTLQTSNPRVFAGGDCVTGPNTAIAAIAQGKKAASSIDRFLGGDGVIVEEETEEEKYISGIAGKVDKMILDITKGVKDKHIQTEFSGSETQALEETNRCFRCGKKIMY